MVEIQGLEVYCSTFQRTIDSMMVDSFGYSELWNNARREGKNVYVLAPFDVSISLMVSRFVFMSILPVLCVGYCIFISLGLFFDFTTYGFLLVLLFHSFMSY